MKLPEKVYMKIHNMTTAFILQPRIQSEMDSILKLRQILNLFLFLNTFLNSDYQNVYKIKTF